MSAPSKGQIRACGVRRALSVALLLGTIHTTAQADWPQWGGPGRDFQAPTGPLASSWPEDGPKPIWKRELGNGYSSIALNDGRLFTMYRNGKEEIVVALDAATGKTLWEHKYEAPAFKDMETRFGEGPNATPLVRDNFVYTLGVSGKLLCLAADSGTLIWAHDFLEELGATPPSFGYSSSPLLHNDRLIVHVGGEGVGLAAFDARSGSVIWKANDFVNTYSSPILVKVDGEEQIVLLTDREVVGVQPTNGEMLWSHPHVNQWKTNISTPIWGDDGILYVSTGGEGGSRGLRLSRKEDATVVEEVWSSPKMKVGQGTAVRTGDYVYASSGSESSNLITAINVKSGKVVWRQRGFAKANLVSADGKLIILDEDGQLALATATPDKLDVHSKVALFKDRAWTVPTIVDGKMYVRDGAEIMALDLK